MDNDGYALRSRAGSYYRPPSGQGPNSRQQASSAAGVARRSTPQTARKGPPLAARKVQPSAFAAAMAMDSAAGGGIGNLSHEQRQELRDVFDTIDQNARGSIPASKLLEVVKALGFERPDETTLDTWMLTVDPDGTGRITYSRLEEFMSLRYDEMNQRQEIMSAFKLFKPDATDVENARITLADLQRISAHLGEHIPDDELREMINIADPNETNSVGFSDFMRMMRKTGLF